MKSSAGAVSTKVLQDRFPNSRSFIPNTKGSSNPSHRQQQIPSPPLANPTQKKKREVLDKCIYAIYKNIVIQNFRHKGLQLLFEKDDRSKVSAQHVERLEHILVALNRAAKPEHMAFPGFYLHPLKGSLKGFWAVTVGRNWRVIFRIKQGHAYDVDLIDYH